MPCKEEEAHRANTKCKHSEVVAGTARQGASLCLPVTARRVFLYQGYLQTQREELLHDMALVMYQTKHIHLSKVEQINIFYWFTSSRGGTGHAAEGR